MSNIKEMQIIGNKNVYRKCMLTDRSSWINLPNFILGVICKMTIIGYNNLMFTTGNKYLENNQFTKFLLASNH